MLCVLVAAIVVEVRSAIFLPAAVVARPDLSYEADNGKVYAYPLGNDSYTWLRMARNQLESGTPCDAIVDGVCRDQLSRAPVHGPMVYGDSWHIEAIAAMHRIVAFFDPKVPLEASARWLQVIVGALAVFPAFRIGWRLGGVVGGFLAAVLTNTNLYVLMRTQNVDNDIWNITLPIFVAATVIEALAARSVAGAAGFAAVAAGFVCLHTAIWSGWGFAFVVAATGLGAASVRAGMRALRGRRDADAPSLHEARLLGVATVVFIGIVVLASDATEVIRHIPLVREIAADRVAESSTAGSSALRAVFPSALDNVQEYQAADPAQLVDDVGGGPLVWAGWFGLALMALWRVEPARVRRGSMAIVGIIYALMVAIPKATVAGGAVAWAVPLVFVFGLALRRSALTATEFGAYALLGTWLFASLHLGLATTRFLLLYGPVLGLAAGGAVGRVVEESARRCLPRRQRLAGWLALAAAVALAVPPTSRARDYVAQRTPKLNDAWVQALVRIGREAPDKAIVNTWWTQGYWAEYYARARVFSDGASLLTRLPYWQAQALLAADGATSVGLMRMLACKSSRNPPPPGELSAVARLHAYGFDEVRAARSVFTLAALSRRNAQLYLAGMGLDAAQVDDVLEATHCTPPPMYVALSDAAVLHRDLRRLGRWDVARATLYWNLRSQPKADAVERMVASFGYDAAQARALWEEAEGLETADAVERFIGAPDLLVGPWLPCRGERTGRMECPVGRTVEAGAIAIDRFTIDPTDPRSARLYRRQHATGQSLPDAVPGHVLLATSTGVVENVVAGGDPDVAVLVDLVHSRVLIGPAYLVRSTLIRLTFLERGYDRRFREWDVVRVPGETVRVWRLQWEN